MKNLLSFLVPVFFLSFSSPAIARVIEYEPVPGGRCIEGDSMRQPVRCFDRDDIEIRGRVLDFVKLSQALYILECHDRPLEITDFTHLGPAIRCFHERYGVPAPTYGNVVQGETIHITHYNSLLRLVGGPWKTPEDFIVRFAQTAQVRLAVVDEIITERSIEEDATLSINREFMDLFPFGGSDVPGHNWTPGQLLRNDDPDNAGVGLGARWADLSRLTGQTFEIALNREFSVYPELPDGPADFRLEFFPDRARIIYGSRVEEAMYDRNEAIPCFRSPLIHPQSCLSIVWVQNFEFPLLARARYGRGYYPDAMTFGYVLPGSVAFNTPTPEAPEQPDPTLAPDVDLASARAVALPADQIERAWRDMNRRSFTRQFDNYRDEEIDGVFRYQYDYKGSTNFSEIYMNPEKLACFESDGTYRCIFEAFWRRSVTTLDELLQEEFRAAQSDLILVQRGNEYHVTKACYDGECFAIED